MAGRNGPVKVSLDPSRKRRPVWFYLSHGLPTSKTVLTIARVVSIKFVGENGIRFAHVGKCATLITERC